MSKKINMWTEKSIILAREHNYLDRLFNVYPMSVNPRRVIDESTISKLKNLIDVDIDYQNNIEENNELIRLLLSQDLFPIKDSYVAYLRRDSSAIERNPKTINRIVSIIHEMGFSEVMHSITEPKETNRQIGPLFKRWVDKKYLGADLYLEANEIIYNYKNKLNLFLEKSDENIIVLGSDDELETIAQNHLGYVHAKGVDFIAKYNNKFVLGEAKFLTDFGGHQNAQMNDAISFITTPLSQVERNINLIAILDGVNYIENKGKLYNETISEPNRVILSSLVLRDYLFSL